MFFAPHPQEDIISHVSPISFFYFKCLKVLANFSHKNLHLAFVLYGEILFLILNALNLPPNLSVGCTS